MTGPWIAVIVALWVVVVVLAVVQIGILRRVLPLLELVPPRALVPSGPSSGTVLPEFEAALGDGTTITAAELAGQPFVLLFASQGCAPCRRLLLQLAGRTWPAEGAAVYLVMAEHARADMPIPACVTPLQEHGGSVSRAFGVSATPLAFAVNAQGVVIESVVPRGPGDLDRLRLVLQPNHARAARPKEPERETAAAVRPETMGR